ncbi:MAG: hypothetical protein WA945_10295 [Arcobacteraceae bacterium]
MTLEQFKKKENTKAKSKLFEFENEILELLNDDYSHQKIADFLNENGVKTSRVNVTKWINKLKNNSPVITKKVETFESPKPTETTKKSLFKESKNVEKNEILDADLSDVIYS